MDKNNPNQLGLGAAVEKLEKHFQEGLNLVKAVRDEAQLELHLAGLDAKTAWTTLETYLSRAEHQALQEAPVALDKAMGALRSLRQQASQRSAKRVGTASPTAR